MAVRQTSRDAYRQIDTQTQERQVLETIDGACHGGTCISEVQDELRRIGILIDKSSISARMASLKENGLIVPASPFKRHSAATGRVSEYWMHRRWKRKPGTQMAFFRG